MMLSTLDAPFVCVPIRPGDDVRPLVAAVADHEPDHLPTVVNGADATQAWMQRKPLNAAWLALAPGGQVIGHIGVRRNTTAADGTAAPDGRCFEVTRLLVHPGHRRLGVATALTRAATYYAHAERVWLTTVEESPACAMYRSMGWVEASNVSLVDDPRPGVLMVPGSALETRSAA